MRLGDRVIALKAATRRDGRDESSGGAAYVLSPSAEPVDFVYYRLSEDDFLFVPRQAIPPAGVTFVDALPPQYREFRNSFTAAFGGSCRQRGFERSGCRATQNAAE